MAKGSSGSDKSTKGKRIGEWRANKTKAQQRKPIRVPTQEEAGTPF